MPVNFRGLAKSRSAMRTSRLVGLGRSVGLAGPLIDQLEVAEAAECRGRFGRCRDGWLERPADGRELIGVVRGVAIVARLAARRVVLPDQRGRVGTRRAGHCPDVPPGVEVAATGGVVVPFDAADDGLTDTRLLTDLGDGEASLVTCRGQCLTGAHRVS